MLVQLDPRGHLLMARSTGGVQVLLKLPVPDSGAVDGPVGGVHVTHSAVEVPRWLLTRFARALHFADLWRKDEIKTGFQVTQGGVEKAMLGVSWRDKIRQKTVTSDHRV